MNYSKLLKEIMYDEDNISYTEKGIKPLFLLQKLLEL